MRDGALPLQDLSLGGFMPHRWYCAFSQRQCVLSVGLASMGWVCVGKMAALALLLGGHVLVLTGLYAAYRMRVITGLPGHADQPRIFFWQSVKITCVKAMILLLHAGVVLVYFPACILLFFIGLLVGQWAYMWPPSLGVCGGVYQTARKRGRA